jgi:hypothetical protein
MQAKYSINNSTSDYNITDQGAPFAEKQPGHNIKYRKNHSKKKSPPIAKGRALGLNSSRALLSLPKPAANI